MADSWTNIKGEDTDFENPYLMPSYHALEGIRQAVKERCLAVSIAVPALLDTEVVRLKTIKSYTDVIQSTMTSLFSYYADTNADGYENSVRVNHGLIYGGFTVTESTGGEDITITNSPYKKSFRLSLSNGEYEIRAKDGGNKVLRCKLVFAYPEISYEIYGCLPYGLTMNLTPWTEATILSAIGDSARIISNPLIVQADWIIQQYKMINKLTLAGTSLSLGSSFNIGYSEYRYASRGFASLSYYTQGWQSRWGLANEGNIVNTVYSESNPIPTPFPAPDTPAMEDVWPDGDFQVYDTSTRRYFAMAKQEVQTAQTSNGIPSEYYSKGCERYRNKATVCLVSSGLLNNADLEFHISPLKISMISNMWTDYDPNSPTYMQSFEWNEFNNELGAEGSYLTYSKTGKNGDSESFDIGNINTIPDAGTLRSYTQSTWTTVYTFEYSNKNWVIFADYDFYKDTVFEEETAWSKATADISKQWVFKD